MHSPRKVTAAEEKRYRAIKAKAERAGQWMSYREMWGKALKVADDVAFVVTAQGTASQPKDGYIVKFF
jgi:hypothetical protein